MKTPRKIGATFGQGVSRRAYQVARSAGAKGSGSPGAAPLKDLVGVTTAASKDYSKSKSKKLFDDIASKGYGVYDETAMRNPDLASLKRYPRA